MRIFFQNLNLTRVFSKFKALALAGVMGVLVFGNNPSVADPIGAYGVTFTGLPGLGVPSLPAFGTQIKAGYSLKKGIGTLDVRQSGPYSVFMGSDSVYEIKSTKYTLEASFNSSGTFTSGFVVIEGKFNGSKQSETLMSAGLTSFGKSLDGYMWGFNTNNIWCSAEINAAAHGCTLSEVVYLGLDNAQMSLAKNWKTYGVALTSVPVPAAAWLFASGLLGLVSVTRRKS